MSQFDTGVEDAPLATGSNGVEGAPLATGDGAEENFDESTLFTDADAGPGDISLDELLGNDGSENAVEGSDSPANDQNASNDQAANKEPAQQQTVDVSKIVAARLKQEKGKLETQIEARIRQEYEAKYAETLDQRVEGLAHQLMAQYPKDIQSLEFAKKLARQELTQNAAQPVQQQTDDSDAGNEQAWNERLDNEEPLLKAALGDPNITWRDYAAKDPIFTEMLRTGDSLLMALERSKIVREYMQKEVAAAKTAGAQEVVQQIKSGNARATAPVAPTNGTGQRTKSISEMTADEIEASIDEAARRGYSGIRI